MDVEGFDPKIIDRYSQQAKELQAFFTEHFYTCTPQILGSLAESCAGSEGTSAFAKLVIEEYCK